MKSDVKNVYDDASLRISQIIERHFSNSLDIKNFEEIGTATELGKTSMKLLDIGCGNGNAAVWFAKAYPITIVGLDASPAMVKQAKAVVEKENLQNRIKVIEGDFQTQKFDEKFDVVFAIDVAMYFGDKKRFYGQLKDLVKPGGWIVTTDYISTEKRQDLLGVLAKWWGLANPPALRTLKTAIKELGLKEHKLIDASELQSKHWKGVLKKVVDREKQLTEAVKFEEIEKYLDGALQIIHSLNQEAHGYVFCILQT